MPIVGDCLNVYPERDRSGEGAASKSKEEDIRKDGTVLKQLREQDMVATERKWSVYSPESRNELIQRLKRKSRQEWDITPSNQAPPDVPMGDATYGDSSHIDKATSNDQDALETPASIERPRSALHSGDFHNESSPATLIEDDERPIPATPIRGTKNGSWFSTSPTTPWFEPQHVSARLSTNFSPNETFPEAAKAGAPLIQTRSRALSVQSSNFIFRPPTSPLAMQSNSSDFDAFHDRHRSRSPDKASRRRTYSPRSLRSLNDLPYIPQMPIGAQARAPGTLRRESTFPYQAHQPRRSLSSFTNLDVFPHTQKPSSRARRPSVTSEASPMQHASLVGRYEESILRGRMSTNASKPVDFVAQIGVLGKGPCRPSLKCPRHVVAPFPAVFYNYGHYRNHNSSSTDGPSPYVGQIDFTNIREQGCDEPERIQQQDHTNQPVDGHSRPQKPRERKSSKRPPGGSYRIPQKGQIQIIIKNPHKTAVKLFLVPYDLTGMDPGQKTFIRQRSFSAGPIIDMPLSSRKNFGSDRPEAALCNSDDPNDRPILRYLIHLHICCTSKGHFYLYKSIRVVFANRVPDGKEKLRHEIQLSEPKFTDYKPERELKQASSASAKERNPPILGPPLPNQPELQSPFGSIGQSALANENRYDISSYSQSCAEPSRDPPRLMSPFAGREEQWPADDPMDLDSPVALTSPMPQRDVEMELHSNSISPYTGPGSPTYRFERLDREIYSSSSNGSRPQTPKPGEGLLAQQIRQHRSPSAS